MALMFTLIYRWAFGLNFEPSYSYPIIKLVFVRQYYYYISKTMEQISQAMMQWPVQLECGLLPAASGFHWWQWCGGPFPCENLDNDDQLAAVSIDIASSVIDFAWAARFDALSNELPATVCVLAVRNDHGHMFLFVATSLRGNRQVAPRDGRLSEDIRLAEMDSDPRSPSHRFWNGCGEQRVVNYAYNCGFDIKTLAEDGGVVSCAVSVRVEHTSRSNVVVVLDVQDPCKEELLREPRGYGCDHFLDSLRTRALRPSEVNHTARTLRYP